MRVAALYFIAAAFVIATATPGPRPWVSGGALAISFDPSTDDKDVVVAFSAPTRIYEARGMGRGGFDSDITATISINAAAFRVSAVKDHPAAQRHAELASMLATMAPPNRSTAEIDADLVKIRKQVDEQQKIFDGLASELEVLRAEVSLMDRRATATEIAARIDATQTRCDEVRGELVHALVGLTATQAEMRSAQRYEDLEAELVSLEEMMMSVRVSATDRDDEREASAAGPSRLSDFREVSGN